VNVAPRTISFTVNDRSTRVIVNHVAPLANVLRDELGLTGTKIGCAAGDCGACTVLLDGAQICACLVSIAQVEGRTVTTVEGLARDGKTSALQDSFHRHGAAQCGICTPGMLMAATDLLAHTPRPTREQIEDALGGVLCRCTGYIKIVEAVVDAVRARGGAEEQPGKAVGARLAKVDGVAKLTGEDIYGADRYPDDALVLRAVRSPYARASFTIGDLRPVMKRFPGLVRIFGADDVPGSNAFGIYPTIKDQPVLAKSNARFRGEAIMALVGDPETIATIRDEDLPITFFPADPVTGIDAALSDKAPRIHSGKTDNILTRGRVVKGKGKGRLRSGHFLAEGSWTTCFVEHAYIEPEAGFAVRDGDRIEITASTQTPYMDRDEIAHVLGTAPEQVRIIPTACGGGFGGKLDMAIQPLLAVAAWHLDRPVRCAFTRPESMAATTKRHPAQITARASCKSDGELVAFELHGDFNTGAYASWGPTVADRVPVHATGPYLVPHVEATSTAVYANEPPAGAFRGFGVPQAALAHEGLMDMLAEACEIDPLEFRLLNAIRVGHETATGQVLEASAGLAECLERLRPHWERARAEAEVFNEQSRDRKLGVGIGCMWYGIGNTSLANPSTIRVGIAKDGRLTLYSGAVDIGQGANTVMTQICADALGVPVDRFTLVTGDTDLTPDAGKTSASRQTFVSGKASQLAGEDLRAKILRRANAGPDGTIAVGQGRISVHDSAGEHVIDLATLDEDGRGDVLRGEGTFDPPTTPLDKDGQGVPYATYGFAAQMAVVDVDEALGTVKVRRIVAAHDVGKAINPIQVEGQIHGGIAQGIGFALMEEYVPGRTENLHDYLIPTFGDMPDIEILLVEDPEPLGPYGAKGIGEPALIPTAPAILGAIHHATGVRLFGVPATPDRVRAAILERDGEATDD